MLGVSQWTFTVEERRNKTQCPQHPEVWLYENMMETEGFCPRCKKSYNLETKKEVEYNENTRRNI